MGWKQSAITVTSTIPRPVSATGLCLLNSNFAALIHKNSRYFMVPGVLFSLLNQQLCNLDGIGGSALADLVTAETQGNTALIGQVGTNPAHEYDILVGGIQGHGVHLLS